MALCWEYQADGVRVGGVQLDYVEEMVPMRGMYRTLGAELEMQRTIRRAPLTAFLSLLFVRAIGAITVRVVTARE